MTLAATCMKCELVIVVGAEDHYSGGNRHNKMMFAQAAVRYAGRHGGRFDRTTVFYFKGLCKFPMTSPNGDGSTGTTYFADGYTDGQIAAMKAALVARKAVVKQANAWADVARHLNDTSQRIDGCEKRVQVLVFFAHGNPDRGIWLAASESKFLNKAALSAVTGDGFLPEEGLRGRRYNRRHVTSWACQTGNHIDRAPEALTMDQRRAGSLAQAMANAWDINVYASVTQTNYGATFSGGLGGMLKDLGGGRRIVDGVLWEDDGADGSVVSSTGGSGPNLEEGMWKFQPGQSKSYAEMSLD